jgi:hypothetical protein
MATFSGGNGAFTPSTSADNWVLDADTAGDVGQVVSIGWGGRLTTSTGYRTRWARPSTNAGSTFTTLNPQSGNPGASPLCRIGTFATAATLGTDPGNNLFAQDWNAHGGLGFVVLPLASPWIVANSATAGHQQIACRNVAGTDANGSNYTVSWSE